MTPYADQDGNYSCQWIYGATTAIQEVILYNMHQGSLFKNFSSPIRGVSMKRFYLNHVSIKKGYFWDLTLYFVFVSQY